MKVFQGIVDSRSIFYIPTDASLFAIQTSLKAKAFTGNRVKRQTSLKAKAFTGNRVNA